MAYLIIDDNNHKRYSLVGIRPDEFAAVAEAQRMVDTNEAKELFVVDASKWRNEGAQ